MLFVLINFKMEVECKFNLNWYKIREINDGKICGIIVNINVFILFVLFVFKDFIVLKFKFLIFLIKSFFNMLIEWILSVSIFENEFGLIVLININVIIILGNICIMFNMNLFMFVIGCNFIIFLVFKNVKGIYIIEVMNVLIIVIVKVFSKFLSKFLLLGIYM